LKSVNINNARLSRLYFDYKELCNFTGNDGEEVTNFGIKKLDLIAIALAVETGYFLSK